MLAFMNTFLSLILPSDKILQSKEIGFREAIPVIESVTSEISKLRSKEAFEQFCNDSEELIQKTLTSQEFLSESRPRRNVQRPSSLSLTDFVITDRIGERNFDYKIEIRSAYFYVIDIFLSEMKRRFDKNSDMLLAISRAEEFDIKLLEPLKDLGLHLPSQEEMTVAKNFIAGRRKIHEEEMSKKEEKERASFKNRFNMLKELYTMKEAFPCVYNFMATLDTFGCSTATTESTFSALERLNNKKRMSMKTGRLKHLTFLAYESKRLANISVEEVMKTFDKNPKRRIQLY